jgi:hypothetical protein
MRSGGQIDSRCGVPMQRKRCAPVDDQISSRPMCEPQAEKLDEQKNACHDMKNKLLPHEWSIERLWCSMS